MAIISHEEQENTIFLRSALAYANTFNLPVFPLVPGEKRPLTAHGLHDATTNNKQISAWWEQYPTANIGIPSGPESGLLIIDEDVRNGSEESIDRLEHADFEPLPETVTVLTPTGGKHRYFQHDERITRTKLDDYPGIDIQRIGKYVVAPPSVHPNGDEYHFELSSHIAEMPIATLPEWFITLAQQPSTNGEVKAKPKEHWVKVLQGVVDGNRNETAASLTGYLLRKYIDVPIAYELVCAWNERNDPPIDAEELDDTFNSILKAELERVRKRRNR